MLSENVVDIFSLKIPSSLRQKDYKNIVLSFLPAALTLFFLSLSFFSYIYFQTAYYIFILAGFVFPGMAHGSLDYYLAVKSSAGRLSKKVILSIYIGIILMVITGWYISPALIMFSFLFNAAFHFGETDLIMLNGKKIIPRIFYGISLIAFYFTSHFKEAYNYLKPFGIALPSIISTNEIMISVILFTLIALFIYAYATIQSTLNLLLILLLGIKLPLILAFGIYYIMIHSTNAWSDLRDGLNLSNNSMIKMALPFTFAGVLFIAIAAGIFQKWDSCYNEPVPLILMGLAAITLPHTIAMSYFYRNFTKKDFRK